MPSRIERDPLPYVRTAALAPRSEPDLRRARDGRLRAIIGDALISTSNMASSF